MTFAQVTANTITTVAGRLPTAARRLDNANWVLALDTAPTALVEATGWFPIVDTARPADTATLTYDRSVQLVASVPTVVWTPRAKSQEELDSAIQQANGTTIRTAADAALVDLRTITSSTGTLTAAQMSNGLRVCARVCIALIRLQLSKLDDVV